MKTNITENDVESAYAIATCAWTEADWTHERKSICGNPNHGSESPCSQCSIVTDKNGDVIYCAGGDSECQTCIDAEGAASGAEAEAAKAMREWRAGNTDGAMRHIKEAVGIENEFGDSPTWGPVLEAMRLAQEDNK